MVDFKGERGENNFPHSPIETAPYISSELPECKSYINRVFSKEGIKEKKKGMGKKGRGKETSFYCL